MSRGVREGRTTVSNHAATLEDGKECQHRRPEKTLASSRKNPKTSNSLKYKKIVDTVGKYLEDKGTKVLSRGIKAARSRCVIKLKKEKAINRRRVGGGKRDH